MCVFKRVGKENTFKLQDSKGSLALRSPPAEHDLGPGLPALLIPKTALVSHLGAGVYDGI